jgi:hypothetical protein
MQAAMHDIKALLAMAMRQPGQKTCRYFKSVLRRFQAKDVGVANLLYKKGVARKLERILPVELHWEGLRPAVNG